MSQSDAGDLLGAKGVPQVSVVIPTRDRAELVVRAVKSALVQTMPDIEVIAVIDGPDPVTVEVLEELDDSRVRIVSLPTKVGGSEARNAGVRTARARWIAFLDDDDEWLPRKIESQLACAEASQDVWPVVSCRVVVRTWEGDVVLPRRVIGSDEPVSEYLFMRRSVFRGEGFLQTTTLFAPRELLMRVPFAIGLLRHQDFDWCLQADAVRGVRFSFVPEREALGIVHWESARPAVIDWRFSFRWANEHRPLFTSSAYAGFLAHQVGPEAARTKDWGACIPILREILGAEPIRAIDVVLYCARWLVPLTALRRVRGLIGAYCRSRASIVNRDGV